MENNLIQLEKQFGSNLKKALKARRIKGVELAEILGVSQSAVSSWVNGGSYPQLDTLYRMCKVLKVDPGTLMFGEADEEKAGNQEEGPLDIEHRMNTVENKVADLDKRVTQIEGKKGVSH